MTKNKFENLLTKSKWLGTSEDVEIIKKANEGQQISDNEAAYIIEHLLDTLIEVGNGVTAEMLHEWCEMLLIFRDHWFNQAVKDLDGSYLDETFKITHFTLGDDEINTRWQTDDEVVCFDEDLEDESFDEYDFETQSEIPQINTKKAVPHTHGNYPPMKLKTVFVEDCDPSNEEVVCLDEDLEDVVDELEKWDVSQILSHKKFEFNPTRHEFDSHDLEPITLKETTDIQPQKPSELHMLEFDERPKHSETPVQTFDSTTDTLKHIKRVSQLLIQASMELIRRANCHDDSKLQEPEKSAFDSVTPRLASTTYGSEEYKAILNEIRPAIDHHYKYNSHHPQHYPDGINGFNLFDLIEMFFDWKAAGERHDDGDIYLSMIINAEKFNLDCQLVSILFNTAQWLRYRPSKNFAEAVKETQPYKSFRNEINEMKEYYDEN